MICRKCPKCGGEWYTAATDPWPCAYCGATLDERHDRPQDKRMIDVTEGRENDVGSELFRHKPRLQGVAGCPDEERGEHGRVSKKKKIPLEKSGKSKTC